MVEFKLLFKEKVTDETAVAPLKKAVDNGNLGPLAVNPASLRIVKEDEGNLRTFSNRNISVAVAVGLAIEVALAPALAVTMVAGILSNAWALAEEAALVVAVAVVVTGAIAISVQ